MTTLAEKLADSASPTFAAASKPKKEVSAGKKVFGVIAGLVQVSLLVAALADIARRDEERINGPKWVWASISFINFIGPIAYFMGGRKIG